MFNPFIGKFVKDILKFCGIFFALLIASHARSESEISSYASVQDDGSLRISGNVVRLHGIYVPPTGQSCYTFIRPIPCGSRTKLALEFRISAEFIHCWPRAANPDGAIIATCTASGEDLSAWMLQRGLAVALPDAPFEYVAMENIARARGIGVWGIPVDVVRRHR